VNVVEEAVRLICGTDSQVAAAVAKRFAHRAGARPIIALETATVAAELASNVLRHGGGGALVCRSFSTFLEIVATNARDCDEAALRACIEAAKRDPFAAPRGLGTIVRMADEIELEVLPPQRIVIRTRKHLSPPAKGRLRTG